MRNAALILTLLLALVLLPRVFAIGVTGCVPETHAYAPYKKISFSHLILNKGVPYTIIVRGDLAPYVVLEDTPGRLEGYLLLPPGLEGGVHTVELVVKESPQGQGMVLATTAVVCPIHITVPYTGERVKLSLTPNVSGENVSLVLTITNEGSRVLQGEVTITLSQQDRVLKTGAFYLTPLAPLDKAVFTLNATGLAEGLYTARAVLTLPSRTVETNTSFTIGGLRVRILNHTRVIRDGAYTNLSFTLKNEWDKPLRAALRVRLESQSWRGVWLDTGFYDLNGFATRTITLPYPTGKLPRGSYFIHYTLTYGKDKLFTEEGFLPVRVERQDTSAFLAIMLGMILTLFLVILIVLLRARRIAKRREERRASLVQGKTRARKK